MATVTTNNGTVNVNITIQVAPCAKCKVNPRTVGSYCKPCMSLINQRNYQKHRDKIRVYQTEYGKSYREENRGKILVRQKEYREENRDKIRAQKNGYREANRETIRLNDALHALILLTRYPRTAKKKLCGTKNNLSKCFGVDRDEISLFLGPKPSADAEIDHIIPKVAWIDVVHRERGYDLPYAMILANTLDNIHYITKEEHKVKTAYDRSSIGRRSNREIVQRILAENPGLLTNIAIDDFDLKPVASESDSA